MILVDKEDEWILNTFTHYINYVSKTRKPSSVRVCIPGRYIDAKRGIECNLSHLIMGQGLKSHNYIVDHIDVNPLNNKRENLQIITQEMNMRKVTATGDSNFLGVYYHKNRNKFRATLRLGDGKQLKYSFKTEREAALARDAMFKYFFPEVDFVPNIIDEQWSYDDVMQKRDQRRKVKIID